MEKNIKCKCGRIIDLSEYEKSAREYIINEVMKIVERTKKRKYVCEKCGFWDIDCKCEVQE